MDTTIDRFGRVVIPKQVRADLGLRPGTVLQIEEGEQEILLKPVKEEPSVVIKDGVLVFSGKATDDILEAMRTHREARLHRMLPGSKK